MSRSEALRLFAHHVRAHGRLPTEATPEALRQAWQHGRDARDLFTIAAMSADGTAIGRAACACVRLALELLPRLDDDLRTVLDVADAFYRGEATEEQRAAAHERAYAIYQAGEQDDGFADEAISSARRAVMGASGAPVAGADVAMDAANSIACASKPVNRDEMRDRRDAALRRLAVICREHLECPGAPDAG